MNGRGPRPPGVQRLVAYSWDQDTGIGEFTYVSPGAGKTIVYARQPAGPQHDGWDDARARMSEERLVARHEEELYRSIKIAEIERSLPLQASS